jgi:hypothetical protein
MQPDFTTAGFRDYRGVAECHDGAVHGFRGERFFHGSNCRSDGTMFAIRSSGATEIRGADLTLAALPTSVELETIPNRVALPGVALHPSGALLYEPFLDGALPQALLGNMNSRRRRNSRCTQRPPARLSAGTVRDAFDRRGRVAPNFSNGG